MIFTTFFGLFFESSWPDFLNSILSVCSYLAELGKNWDKESWGFYSFAIFDCDWKRWLNSWSKSLIWSKVESFKWEVCMNCAQTFPTLLGLPPVSSAINPSRRSKAIDGSDSPGPFSMLCDFSKGNYKFFAFPLIWNGPWLRSPFELSNFLDARPCLWWVSWLSLMLEIRILAYSPYLICPCSPLRKAVCCFLNFFWWFISEKFWIIFNEL